MTAVLESATQKAPACNRHEHSLQSGFYLNQAQINDIAQQMRTADFMPVSHSAVQFPPRRTMPKTSNPDEREEMLHEVDESNRRRATEVEQFFSFLGTQTARLLASKVKSDITGFCIVICPNDLSYTLIPER